MTAPPADNHNIPDPSIRRLSAYLRYLENLVTTEQRRVSSRQLAGCVGGSDAQVRRDLALFGQFGRRGVGYEVDDLIQVIRTIFGTRRQWPVVVVGAGLLCQALLRYQGFKQRGFTLVGAFDTDPRKLGARYGDVTIQHIDEVEAVIARHHVRLAILTVPATAAQRTAERLVRAGIEGIMNFASASLNVPADVHVNRVDLTASLEQLSFQLSSHRS